MTNVLEEKTVRSRKDHGCDSCGVIIKAGQDCVRYSAVDNDSGFFTAHFHQDCRREEVRLNNLMRTHSEDEWMSLLEIIYEYPEELESLPEDVALRLKTRKPTPIKMPESVNNV